MAFVFLRGTIGADRPCKRCLDRNEIDAPTDQTTAAAAAQPP
jgi:hypothetical protein